MYADGTPSDFPPVQDEIEMLAFNSQRITIEVVDVTAVGCCERVMFGDQFPASILREQREVDDPRELEICEKISVSNSFPTQKTLQG